MEIIATFKDGRQVVYTVNVLPLLISDHDVIRIINANTCEVLK